MSSLLFDAAYTGALLDIGYRDAHQRAVEIEAFLHASIAAQAGAGRGVPARPLATSA
jgi:hypothetical protein